VRRDADDLASAASWVATEIVESAADISRELARHDESSMQMAQEARLELQLIPSSFLLSSAIVAVPALIEAHAAAEAELQMPGPKVFLCNAAVLVTTALTVVVWLCLATLRLPPPSSDGEVPVVFINYYQTMLEWLQSVPGAAWASYQSELSARPVLVKALLTGVTYVAGDMIAQVVQQSSHVARRGLRRRSCFEKLLRMDQLRYARSGLVGLFPLGPLAHFYYEFVSARLGEWPTAGKIALDQTLYLATYNSVYYIGLGLLAGRRLGEVLPQYRRQFWQLLTAGWRIWPRTDSTVARTQG